MSDNGELTSFFLVVKAGSARGGFAVDLLGCTDGGWGRGLVGGKGGLTETLLSLCGRELIGALGVVTSSEACLLSLGFGVG